MIPLTRIRMVAANQMNAMINVRFIAMSFMFHVILANKPNPFTMSEPMDTNVKS